MRSLLVSVCAAIMVLALMAGCATTPPKEAPKLGTSAAPAWSLRSPQDGMIVAVSPARQTLQIAGSAGTLLGAGISAIQDAKHRRAVEEVLEGYDTGAVFDQRVAARFGEVVGERLHRVPPLGSIAGYNSVQQAEEDRYRGLSRKGHDLVLDLRMTYGIFGFEGTLIAKLKGEMLWLPSTKTLWRDGVMVSTAPLLAGDKLTDPTDRLTPNIMSPRLSVEENATEKWTADGGALLRKRFETAVDGAVSAVLTDLGVVDEPLGNYCLARHLMNKKRFGQAETHYRKAMAQDPTMIDAKSGLAVNLAHDKRLDEAIALANEVVRDAPDYGPAYLNLAWWHAIDRKDADTARSFYKKAQALGMPADKKIEKALKKAD